MKKEGEGKREGEKEREGERVDGGRSLRPSFSNDWILTSSNGTMCCLLYCNKGKGTIIIG